MVSLARHTSGTDLSVNFRRAVYAGHKVVCVRVLIADKLNYFMTSLRGKNEVQVKFENSMHNYNVTLSHWHHTLGCQCSSFGIYAVHKVVIPIVWLVTRNPAKNRIKTHLHTVDCNYGDILNRNNIADMGMCSYSYPTYTSTSLSER